MKKTNTLHIVLELITILSNIVIGVTILTFLTQGVQADKSYIGSIVLAIGATEMVEFLSLKDLAKRRHVLNAIIAILSMAFGVLLLSLPLELPIVCIVLGIVNICFLVVRVVDAAINLLRQPFLQSFIIIICILETMFSIFLIVKTVDALNNFLTYLGIALLVEAFLLVVEFVIHRYQK